MRGKQISGFVSREQLLADLFDLWEPVIRTEYIPLEEACGRVTAEPVLSKNTLPVCRTSGCDGIAVRSADFADGLPDYRRFEAGRDFFRADTGDDFPDGFDAVIMIEEVDFDADGRIAFISEDVEVKAGSHVTPAGSIVARGDLLLEAGVTIRPFDLSALAMGGIFQVPVRKRPVAAFLPTGSELVPLTDIPKRGENIDSNSYMIRELLKEFGAEPLVYPITPDDPEQLRAVFADALEKADIILLNGGTAKGSEDFTFSLLSENGTLLHHYVAAAPGRPLAAAMIKGKPVLNLPGPPGAAFYTAQWCLKPVISRALGVPSPENEALICQLASEIRNTPDMAILVRMKVVRDSAGYLAYPVRNHGNKASAALTTNAMYVSPLGESVREAGEEIRVELLRGRETIPVR